MCRPVTYKDWRNLWHVTARSLGWHIFFCWSANRPLLNRHSWKLLCRLQRIKQRLDIENKVKDESWCEAMFELIFAEWGDK